MAAEKSELADAAVADPPGPHRVLIHRDVPLDDEDARFLACSPVASPNPFAFSTPLRLVVRERRVRLLIGILVSSAHEGRFDAVLAAVAENLVALEASGVAWTEVAVVVVVDGLLEPYSPVHVSLERKGLLDRTTLSSTAPGVCGWVFERILSLPCAAASAANARGNSGNDSNDGGPPYFPPLQITVVIPHARQTLLSASSARTWFFALGARAVQPESVLLLEDAVAPAAGSLAALLRTLALDPKAGAVSGSVEYTVASWVDAAAAIANLHHAAATRQNQALGAWFGLSVPPSDGFVLFRWAALRGRPLEALLANLDPLEGCPLDSRDDTDPVPRTAPGWWSVAVRGARVPGAVLALVDKPLQAWTARFDDSAVAHRVPRVRKLGEVANDDRLWVQDAVVAPLHVLLALCPLLLGGGVCARLCEGRNQRAGNSHTCTQRLGFAVLAVFHALRWVRQWFALAAGFLASILALRLVAPALGSSVGFALAYTAVVLGIFQVAHRNALPRDFDVVGVGMALLSAGAVASYVWAFVRPTLGIPTLAAAAVLAVGSAASRLLASRDGATALYVIPSLLLEPVLSMAATFSSVRRMSLHTRGLTVSTRFYLRLRDSQQTFRSWLLPLWFLSNAGLSAALLVLVPATDLIEWGFLVSAGIVGVRAIFFALFRLADCLVPAKADSTASTPANSAGGGGAVAIESDPRWGPGPSLLSPTLV